VKPLQQEARYLILTGSGKPIDTFYHDRYRPVPLERSVFELARRTKHGDP
jgi:hypothetical protein